jgi:5-methyltetrahydropteroyltriglutamate--homocysteine methyltransferase
LPNNPSRCNNQIRKSPLQQFGHDDESPHVERQFTGCDRRSKIAAPSRQIGTIMKTSTDRILTTHVGSLIRPQALQDVMRAKQSDQYYDQVAFESCLRESVTDIVRRQAEIGIDVPSDGEFGKAISWNQYVVERLSGFELREIPKGFRPGVHGADRTKFTEFYAELDAREPMANARMVACVGPVKYTGQQIVQRDIDNFNAALKGVNVTEAFMPVVAPSSVIPDRKNEYYKSEDDWMEAITDAMRFEYKMIVDAGFVLQIDDARAANAYDRMVPPATLEEYRRWLAKFIEALNHALEGIPEDKIRYHICWGSWPGPHVSDVPLKAIVDLVLKVRAGAYVIESANPRHEHEWRIWKEAKLPPGRVLIPGVISHATNVVEHPELVSERIQRFASVVGRENVMAGTDCGFAQGTFYRRVHPSIMWAKLQALVEGARLASAQLWG